MRILFIPDEDTDGREFVINNSELINEIIKKLEYEEHKSRFDGDLDNLCANIWVNFVPKNDYPQLIPFIKEIRKMSGCGLKDAKDAVERCKPFMIIKQKYWAYIDTFDLEIKVYERKQGLRVD